MSISIIDHAIAMQQNPSQVSDWAPIINNCIAAHPEEIITFPPRPHPGNDFFQCNATIEIGASNASRPVVLRGEMADWGRGTRLRFPAGVQAMSIRAPRSRLEDIAVIGPGRGTGAAIARAVLVEAQCELRRFTVYQFNGTGIEISADRNRTPPTNANNWFMERCFVKSCGLHGIYVHGGDTNNGVAIATSVTDCLGHAVWDDSFLGCQWLGGHVDATQGQDAYRAERGSRRALFLGCYSEGSAPITVELSSMLIGGHSQTAFQGTGTTLHDAAMRNVTLVSPTLQAADKINDADAQWLCRLVVPDDEFYIVSYDGRLRADGTPKYPNHFGWVRALFRNQVEAFAFSFGKAQGGGGQRR